MDLSPRPTEPEDEDHRCRWRDQCERHGPATTALEEKLAELNARVERQAEENERQRAEIAELKSFRPKSERMEPINRAVRKARPQDPSKVKDEADRKRRENRRAQESLPQVRIEHRVEESRRACEGCGAERVPLGKGRVTGIVELRKSVLELQKHILETLRCPNCKGSIVSARPPKRALDQGRYGKNFISTSITSKCIDAQSIQGQCATFRRLGLRVSQPTLNHLFNQSGELTGELVELLAEQVRRCPILLTDDTSIRSQGRVPGAGREQAGQVHNGRFWAFLGRDHGDTADVEWLLYHYSKTKEGVIPAEILDGACGALIADAASNFNEVCRANELDRAACWAHLRRYFHKAKDSAPTEAKVILDKILELFVIEREAGDLADRAARRAAESAPIVAEIKAWLLAEQDNHSPKSPLGKAIRYALGSEKHPRWPDFERFLGDPRIPLDNNASERALRRVARGRDNYQTVGGDKGGRALANLMTLCMNCELVGISANDYLADILVRLTERANLPVAEQKPLTVDWLPQFWKPPPTGD